MTRIATSSFAGTGVADIMRAQRELADLQRQAGSGRLAADARGYGATALSLTNARMGETRWQSYVDAGKTLNARLEVQAVALTNVREAGEEMRTKIVEAIGLNDGGSLQGALSQMFDQVKSSLNMTFGGAYLFSGEAEDVAPVTVDSLTDLAALPSATDAFINEPRKRVQRVDDATVLEVAPTAHEAAQGLMSSMKRLQELLTGPMSPLGKPMTDAQLSALRAELDPLKTATAAALSAEAVQGEVAKQAENAITSAQGRADLFTKIAGDIENADMPKVATEISMVQTQLQTSAAVLGKLREFSLLDYLR